MRLRRPLITLLTDFGLDDIYVGVMKGVIAGIEPRAAVIDITHGIAPHDLLQAGLRWAAATPHFPRGTVHLAVVDPGVGGARAIIALRARGSVFIAPDNGLLGFVARPGEAEEAVRVESRRYFLPRVSRTFHGRDLFAPVAARVAGGLPLGRLGPKVARWERLQVPAPRERSGPAGPRLEGEIVDIDGFGNCITNLREPPAGLRDVRVGRWRLSRPAASYGACRPGEPLAIFGSSGYLEISVNRGRADRVLGLRRGQRVSAALGERRRKHGPPRRVRR